MAIHLTFFGLAYVVGAAAVPANTSNAVQNLGTELSCTFQGFVIYVTSLSAISYYVTLSINCSKSDERRFQKYVHFGVHVFPICAGIYLGSIFEAFNNSGFGKCFLRNDPIGCDGTGSGSEDDESYVACTRGTESRRTAWLVELLWIIPLYTAMIVSTVVMFNMYRFVQKHQSRSHVPSTSVAKQAIMYLLVLYAGILPWAIVRTLEWSGKMSTETAVRLNVFAEVMFALFGLVSTLCYYYVTDPRWVADCNEDEGDDDGTSSNHDGCCDGMSEFIFDPPEEAKDDPGTEETSSDPASVPKESTASVASNRSKGQAPRRKSRRRSSRISFNIFDGTNASGLFAEFIFDDDSDDEGYDQEENEKWAACQDHI